MPQRLVLLPLTWRYEMRPHPEDPKRQVRVEVHDPDTLGVTVEATQIKSDYRDCGKVLVTAPQKTLDELAAKSRAHFLALWGPQRQPPAAE